jgi:hypothetical protein
MRTEVEDGVQQRQEGTRIVRASLEHTICQVLDIP